MPVKWLPVVKTKSSLLFQWLVFEGHRKKYYQSSLNLHFGLQNQKIISDEISIDLNEFIQLESILTAKIKSNRNYFDIFIMSCYKQANILLKNSEEIRENKNLEQLNKFELLLVYIKYQATVLSLMPFLNTILVIDVILKKELKSVLDKDMKIINTKEQDLLLSKLIIPKKKVFLSKKQKQFLKLRLSFKKIKKLISIKI